MDDELKWFIGFIGIFAILWLGGGGLNSENSKKPFITPAGETYGQDFFPAKGNGNGTATKPATGKTLGDISSQVDQAKTDAEQIQSEIQKLEEAGASSPLKGKIFIEKVNPAYDNYYNPNDLLEGDKLALAGKEYVLLHASDSNKEDIAISGLTLKSVISGKSSVIGAGTYLPYPGVINDSQKILLAPGAFAYIVTGFSPTGFSFKLNKCAGYFGQFQDFLPALPIDCPLPKFEATPKPPNQFSDQCLDYIDTLPACKITTEIPNYLPNNCKDFLSSLNYNSCVRNHKNDIDFYNNEWRIFLNRNELLWKSKRETIQLLDQNGKVIDSKTY
jgi:hypothetical protein